MALQPCPNCGKQINRITSRCKYCGWYRATGALPAGEARSAAIPAPARGRPGLGKALLIGAGALLALRLIGDPAGGQGSLPTPTPQVAAAAPVAFVSTNVVSPPTPTAKPPTATPAPPTATPMPAFQPQTQELGPIQDTRRDERFSVEVTVTRFEAIAHESYNAPRTGNVYVLVGVEIKNLGPGSIRSIGPTDFKTLDANGVLSDYHYARATESCRLRHVDLVAGGKVQGCIAYEVPAAGKLELVYAPYRYESLAPGRYLSFVLRPGEATV